MGRGGWGWIQPTPPPPPLDSCSLRSMPLWSGGPTTRTLPTVSSLHQQGKQQKWSTCVSLKTKLWGICRGFVPDIQLCCTHGREDLVNATTHQTQMKKKKKKKTLILLKKGVSTPVVDHVLSETSVKRSHIPYPPHYPPYPHRRRH